MVERGNLACEKNARAGAGASAELMQDANRSQEKRRVGQANDSA